MNTPRFCAVLVLGSLAALGCSRGGGGVTPPPPPPTVAGLVSGRSPLVLNCVPGQAGTLFTDSEVEPCVAVNPLNPQDVIGVWQQDRWSNGSAQGLAVGVSQDGGLTWTVQPLPFSRCAGGNAANGGDFDRATDPWISFAPDGTAYAMSLSTAGDANAMLVARSADGGRAWSRATPLILDGASAFNDKNTLTADPGDARYVYAVWDRLGNSGGGPAMLARTLNGGATWEAARPIFDPGLSGQTIGNLIVVLPSGALVNVFTLLEEGPSNTTLATVAAIRSTDRGVTWSAPVRIAELLALGARDPENGTEVRDGSIVPQAAVGPDGSIAVVWQDARFSGGLRDGIALSRSTDGGLHWTVPVRVNPSNQHTAFTPSIAYRPDGTFGISYYDFRTNTADAATLPTGYYLARSGDGVNWTEAVICEPFNLATAPHARGLFLGDYQGLVSQGNGFLAFFARTTGSLTNRTDIHAVRVAGALNQTEAGRPLPAYQAQPVGAWEPSLTLRRQVSDHILRSLSHPPVWVRSNRPELAQGKVRKIRSHPLVAR